MRRGVSYTVLFVMVLVLLHSCQKEIYFDFVQQPHISAGSLSASGSGDCLPKTVSGDYKVNAVLNSSNKIEVQVNVTAAGSYTILTDTVNGYSFSSAGNFTATGLQTVSLSGTGMPLAAGTNIFHIKYSGTTCAVSVTVLSAGGPAAVFTLQGAGGSCLGSVINGSYVSGTPLNATNTVVLNVNVTQTGTYSVSTTTANGFVFAATGSFTSTGLQAVILNGTGAPVNSGVTSFSISAGGGACNFSVNVTAPSLADYFPRTSGSNWTYEIDDNITDTARFFVVPPVYTVNGVAYNIFMVTAGITVDSSGFYRKAGNEYFRYRDVGDFIGFDDPIWADYKFMDDAAPAGTNWKSAVYTGQVTIGGLPPQPMTIRFSTTVLQKDISLSITTSVGTVNYSSVIVIEEKYERLIAGSWTDITSQVGSFKKYYAKDIGLVKYEAINAAGAVSAFFELKQYQVL